VGFYIAIDNSILQYIQMLRTVCTFSELNYTLIFEDKKVNVTAEINTLPNLDSGVIKENIELDLKKNREYSLKLRVTSQSQTATSQKHVFCKLYSSLLCTYSLKVNYNNVMAIPINSDTRPRKSHNCF
jgi:hypothetical protein